MGLRGRLLLGAVVALTLLAAYMLASSNRRRYEALLSGMWVGDPAFLRKAGLTDMQLYFSPPSDSDRGRRQGYAILTDGSGGFVANQGFDASVRVSAVR